MAMERLETRCVECRTTGALRLCADCLMYCSTCKRPLSEPETDCDMCGKGVCRRCAVNCRDTDRLLHRDCHEHSNCGDKACPAWRQRYVEKVGMRLRWGCPYGCGAARDIEDKRQHLRIVHSDHIRKPVDRWAADTMHAYCVKALLDKYRTHGHIMTDLACSDCGLRMNQIIHSK